MSCCPAKEPQAEEVARRRRILIVEDHPLNLKLLRDLLEAHGYETLQTGDGLEALHLARQDRPDLILMDLQLPDISGLEVTRWLRREPGTRNIPIVAITAFAMREDEKKALDNGCSAYIAKPISIRHMLEIVAALLDKDAA
ncbi:MAG TPA: response regulator [Stellaceae bacterium]|nr:response regulator [Stellaceae bacterium]